MTSAGNHYQYIYDAEGRLVTTASRPDANCALGTTTLADYVVDQFGRQITEADGSAHWRHTNVYANGELLATYDGVGLHYALNDWLGDKRVQALASSTGTTVEETCWNLPFNDGFGCSGTGADATEQHYTGKEHDKYASQLDHLGARSYTGYSGRFLSPDPSGLAYADPTNPQSLNLYAYVLNNPLKYRDPTGLDCVYFNDAGNGVESVDHNSDSGECGNNGGDWVNGTTYSNLASYNSKSDTWNIASYGNEGGTPTVYWSQAYAPGPGGGGTDSNGNPLPCSGNCDTANGYSSTGYAFFGSQIANGNWYDALHWAVGQNWQIPAWQKFIINDPEGRNWCGAGGTGTPSGNDDWACMAHDYNYMSTGNTWPGNNYNPFSKSGQQLQNINQTLCNNVSSSNIQGFFTAAVQGCR